MKIQDLTEELARPNVSTKKFKGEFYAGPDDDGFNPNTKQKALGRGGFSSVKAHPTDPHAVKKHNHTPIDPDYKDGFNTFVEYIINNNLTDNIHFPRVYNVKTIVDKTGRRIHTYDLERLVPIHKVSLAEIKTFMDIYLDMDKVKEILSYDEDDGEYVEPETPEQAAGIIAAALFRSTAGWGVNVAKTKQLSVAMEVIGKISADAKNETAEDMHEDNFMWRRTPSGLILVFSDPLE